MSATWLTYLLLPLAIGGSARLSATVTPASGSEVTTIRALVGATAATSETDPTLASVDVASGPDGSATAWNLPILDGQVVSWFVQLDPGGWEAGPVVEDVDLRASFTSSVNNPLRWFLDRLKALESISPVFSGRRFEFREAYPRDVAGWPSASVLLDSLVPTPAGTWDLEQTEGTDVGEIREFGVLYHASMSCIAWCETPEDRQVVFRWLAERLPIIRKFSAFAGLMEPTFRLGQEEDFESFGVPTFKVTATFEADVHCIFTTVNRTGFGQVTTSTSNR